MSSRVTAEWGPCSSLGPLRLFSLEWQLPRCRPVFFRPLVEEKVKEQLEAAKPEPVIEEVVSPWEAPPCWGCFLL